MSVSPVSAPVAPAASQPVQDEPKGVGGIRGKIADILRGAGSGYAEGTKQVSVQSDKAMIYPMESLYTTTNTIKKATENIKFVNKATGLLHTVGIFGGLIVAGNTSGMLKAPGTLGSELAHRAADLIDGKKTAQGSKIGWFADGKSPASGAPVSAIGQALAGAGVGA